jgi:tetratricopeptide (TPR) repeat protein
MKPHRVFVLIVAFLAFLGAGYAQKAEEGKIPITTSSEEARKEFLQGRELEDKLLVTNSIQHFDKAISLDPDFATAYWERTNVALSPNDFFDHLKKAVALADKVSEGERLLILATEANANGNLQKQKENLEKLTSLYPNDERAHFYLGTFFYGQQGYDEAIDHLKKASELAPGYSIVYNMLGYTYREMEKYSDAEQAFKKYAELIPNDPNPSDSYAELLMKMGRFDESITNYEKALAADPTFASSYNGIAANYMYKGEPQKGAAQVKRLLTIARNDAERRGALFTQTVLYADAGKMNLALSEMEKQYAMGEKAHDVAAMATDLGLKGNILTEMGKYNEAQKAFDKGAKMIEQSNLSQEIKDNVKLGQHYNAAIIALGKKDLKKAMAAATEFRNGAETGKNPNQLRQAHEVMGMIALAEKKYDDAVAELQQASMQNPSNLYRLALAYKGKGDNAKAKEFCTKAAHFYGIPNLNYAFVRAKATKMLAGMK